MFGYLISFVSGIITVFLVEFFLLIIARVGILHEHDIGKTPIDFQSRKRFNLFNL